MDENEIDENPSSFPLFNFAALEQSISTTPGPLNINVPKNVFNIPTEKSLPKFPEKEAPTKEEKKRTTRAKSSKKKQEEGQLCKVTIKDILEDLQTGIPMESDLKMKEEKLKKMKEGKLKKKNQKNENKKNNDEKSLLGKTVSDEPSTLLSTQTSLMEDNPSITPYRITFKDGKPVLENIESSQLGLNSQLTLVENTKPQKVTSMSFRKKSHTKQWTEDETRKFYKALELFGSDFSMISKLFPERDRTQIKNKLRKEEKDNQAKIEEAFKSHKAPQKPLMSHLGDFPRKKLKLESESSINLEKLNGLTFDHENRTMSNYSLDSVDTKIINDIKEICQKESQQQQQKYDILKLKENSLFEVNNSSYETKQEKVPSSKLLDEEPFKNNVPNKEVGSSLIEVKTDSSSKSKTNNLFLNMFEK